MSDPAAELRKRRERAHRIGLFRYEIIQEARRPHTWPVWPSSIGAKNVFVVGLASPWSAKGRLVRDGRRMLRHTGRPGRAAGVSGLLTGFPALRGVLLLGGAAFLGYLGTQAWRSSASALSREAGQMLSARTVTRRTVAVSLPARTRSPTPWVSQGRQSPPNQRRHVLCSPVALSVPPGSGSSCSSAKPPPGALS